MTKTIFLLSVVLLPFALLSAESETETTFYLPLPEGWQAATIPFPIPFAPELDYEGVEDLRFAPGMFEVGSEGFWTYSFVWWIPKNNEFSSTSLEKTLITYYEGLARNEYKKAGGRFEAKVFRVATKSNDEPDFVGSVLIFEPYSKKENTSLNIRIVKVRCPGPNQAVFFELSPQPFTHELWDDLEEIRKGFRCEK